MENTISYKDFPSALYCRVSNTDQTTLNQKLRLIKYAEENNIKYDLYEEVESSRKTRPVKQELMNRLRRGDYKSVIIFKLDRWARSSTELILDTKEILSKGIGFISLSDNLDFTSAAGKLQFQILSAFAEFERELIRERTIEGLARARTQGKNPGRPKGSKDKKQRPKSGYYIEQAKRKKHTDETKGNFKPIQTYFEKSSPE